MIRPLILALALAVLPACSQTRELAMVPEAGDSIIAEPVIDTNLFPLNSTLRVEEYYRRRLAEQSPIPLGDRNSYTYYRKTERRY